MRKNYILLSFLLSFSFSFSQISTFPHSSSFESGQNELGSSASDALTKWTSATSGIVNGVSSANFNASGIQTFQEDASGTPSSGTGPSSAQAGSQYIFVESSGSSVEGKAFKLAAVYDFTSKANAQLSFYFHNYSYYHSNGYPNTYGPAAVSVYVYDPISGWSSALWTYNSNTQNLDQWQNVTVDLSPYDGKDNIQIWFSGSIATSGESGYWGYQSDFALDNVVVSADTLNGVTSYYVDDTGSNSNNGLTSAAPFATIAYAVSQSDNGTGVTINVGAGSYNEEAISISKSNITITGAGSSQTIFDGDLDGRFATISANDVTIQNMQIKEYGVASSCSSSCGGGAILLNSSITGLTVNDVIFDGNVTDGSSGDGGVIELLSSSTATFNSCIFRNNRAGASNAAESGKNGAVAKSNGSNTVSFNNSLFYDNTAKGVGAVYGSWNSGGTATFTNCTMYGNVSYDGDSGVSYNWQGTVNIRNSIVRNTMHGASSGIDLQYVTGINVNYGSIDGTNSMSGTNSTSDPLFVDVSNDDYSLQNGSPAIDAGSSTYAPVDDINDFSRPQGQSDDLGAYEHRNTWDGSTDTDWSTAANWSENIVPVAGRSPIIADVTNQPIISSDDGSSGDVSLEDITINSGAELTINKEASLTLTDDFTNNSGSVYLESDSNEFASIIVQGDASGNITYKRFVNYASDGEWDLIGSPVDGLDINTFVSTNTSGTATLASNGVQYALGVYDNSNNDWSNYTSDGSGAGNVNAAGNFDIGKGYQIASVQGGTQILEFTGTIATSDQLQSVINNHASSGRRWNLVANPFPSYLKLNDDADGTNNFLTVNNSNSVIDSAFLAAYGWDADGTGWTPRGQDFNSDTAVYVAPGQAFMIAANSASAANLSFTESMQTSIGSDDFIQGDVLETKQIILKLFDQDDSLIKNTHVKFRENMTEGLDPGYDLGCYNQDDALSTRLLEGDNGINFEYQQLPLSIMNNAVIPLVINRLGGEEFRISLFTSTVENQEIFLEDTLLGTFTNLLQDDYSLLAQQDIEGVGRFFIHMSSETMSSDDLDKNFLSIYKENDLPYITLEGLLHNVNNAKFRLYDIFGKLVINSSLESSSNTQKISTVGLSSGIYIAEVESGINKLIKKILIQ